MARSTPRCSNSKMPISTSTSILLQCLGARLTGGVAGERCLVKDVGGQSHVRGVDKSAVTADGTDAPGFGQAVRVHGRLRLSHLAGRGREHVVGDGHLVGMDGPLAV